MSPGFIRKWRHRLDFLHRETAAQARGLADLIAALVTRPRGNGPLVVLVATPAFARFLTRIGVPAGLGALDVRAVPDLPTLERWLTEFGDTGPIVVAGELYARFHATLAPHVAAGRIIPV